LDADVKTFSDYFAILRRRKQALWLVFTCMSLVGVYIVYSIEPVYASTATFRIQQQTVTDYLETPGSGFVDEQIQLVRQRVMSADRLSALIDKYTLFPDNTGGGPANYGAVETLREAIEIEPEYTEVFSSRSGRSSYLTIAFDLTFEYSDAEITQQVASDLAEAILVENQNIRVAQAEDTIEFLTRDLEAAQDDVDKAALALANFREEHAGNLPDMTDFNLQAIQRTERQIEAIDEDIRRARDRRQELETELADPNLLATVYDEDGEPIVGTAQRLADAQRERLQLLSIYSPEHPDVVKIEKEIEILESDLSTSGANASDIEKQLEFARTDLAVARQRYGEDHPDVRRLLRSVDSLEEQLAEAQRRPAGGYNMASQDPVVQQLQSRIRDQEGDIRTFQARRAELVDRLQDYESKLLRMPRIEREYAALTRDSEAAIARHKELREKLEEARTAGKLEAEGGGARFILTDPPQLPWRPDKPNRLSLLIISIFLAIIISVAAAITIDATDGTVRETGDILDISSAPPIAVIPYIETPADYRKRIAFNILMSGLGVGCIVMSFLIISHAA
jgi:uncharacterized protein involved in exopolysaccharide biosynthesis